VRATAGELAPVTVCNPLSQGPYRTGSYLIYDFPHKDDCPDNRSGKDNFRCELQLVPNPCRASGSHQLDYSELVRVLESIPQPAGAGNLFLVDLREETHGFLGDRAVSWYADNDFSNVGYPWDWIRQEEKYRLDLLNEFATAAVFCIEPDTSDNRAQQRMLPTSYRMVDVGLARTEEEAVHNLKAGNFTITYVRIPVTDHCAPTDAAINALRALANTVTVNDWVHFHCHGGDGRTTTFLALYDMWCWKRRSKDPFPTLEAFACRQYGLFPYYCLNPDGCDCEQSPSQPMPSPSQPTPGWKRPLALQRWEALTKFHANPLGGGP
jgi:hypothetical protein